MDGKNKKFIADLQKKAGTRRESGLYTVDGPKMAAELEPSEVEALYVTEEFLASAHPADCAGLLSSVGYTLIRDSEMRQISDTVNPQGILALVRQKKPVSISSLAKGPAKPLFLILETIQDPGNLGTIIRTAEAAGISGLIMNRGTVDIYAPKVVRSTMGALLRVPFVIAEDILRTVDYIKSGEYTGGEKVQILAAHTGGAVDYAAVDYRLPSAVMIGNEAHGLSAELAEKADQKICIPMCGRTESLNAAVAAAVLSFEAARQRRLDIKKSI